MTVDVLLPFHRNDPFLRASIDSVFASKKIDFKLILIDDRPKIEQSNTQFLKGLRQIQLIQTSGLTGYGNALKEGARVLSSEFVALMNSDDIMSPNRFESQVKSLETYDITFTKIKRISSKGRQIPSFTGDISSDIYDPFLLGFGAYGANATWCMKKEWMDKHFFYDDSECLDWRIALESFSKSKVGFANESTYLYRKHPKQITSNRSISKHSMYPLYLSWTCFLGSYNIPKTTFEVFSFIATPWNRVAAPEISDLLQWLQYVDGMTVNLPSEIQKNISALLSRRFLVGSINSKSNQDRYRYLLRGIGGIPDLLSDLLRSIPLKPFH